MSAQFGISSNPWGRTWSLEPQVMAEFSAGHAVLEATVSTGEPDSCMKTGHPARPMKREAFRPMQASLCL